MREINGFEIETFNQCIECNEILFISEFHKGRNQCKKCRWSKLEDPFWSVYYLPNENYVGSTKRLTGRIKNHRNKHNRNVEDWRLLASFPTLHEARNYEAMLQASMGINGLKYN